jgi:hypothetical protein
VMGNAHVTTTGRGGFERVPVQIKVTPLPTCRYETPVFVRSTETHNHNWNIWTVKTKFTPSRRVEGVQLRICIAHSELKLSFHWIFIHSYKMQRGKTVNAVVDQNVIYEYVLSHRKHIVSPELFENPSVNAA